MTSEQKAEILKLMTNVFMALARADVGPCDYSIPTQDFHILASTLGDIAECVSNEFIKLHSGYNTLEEAFNAIFDLINVKLEIVHNHTCDANAMSTIAALN